MKINDDPVTPLESKENRRKAKDKAEQVLRIGKNVVIDDTNHLEVI